MEGGRDREEKGSGQGEKTKNGSNKLGRGEKEKKEREKWNRGGCVREKGRQEEWRGRGVTGKKVEGKGSGSCLNYCCYITTPPVL